MWNLMVVEDEALVRVGLRYMVDWESHDVHWKAEASNGEEALRLMEEQDIHIVMTDIRMPGMDGLALADQIKERYSHVQIIFLSSYDNFPYVKEALRLGAIDYLHKPTMAEEEIAGALTKAKLLLEKDSSTRSKPGLSEQEKNDLLLSLLDTYTFPDRAALKELQGGWLTGPLWVCLFRVRDDAHQEMTAAEAHLESGRASTGDNEGDPLKFLSVRYVIDEYVSRDWGGDVFHRNHREIIWLAPATDKAGRTGAKDRGKYLERLRQKVFDILNEVIVFSASGDYKSLEDIPAAYMEALLRFPINKQSDSHHVRMVKEYIDAHLVEELSLQKASEMTGITAGYLSRIFQREIGESFSEYIIRNKMTHAQRLLRESSMKVYEVAAAVGYANPHYFSKLFKERTGMTPLEYRNR